LALETAPAGFSIASPPPIERREFPQATINLNINFDVAATTAVVAAAWLVRFLKKAGPNAQLQIDGDRVEIDEAKIAQRLKHDR